MVRALPLLCLILVLVPPAGATAETDLRARVIERLEPRFAAECVRMGGRLQGIPLEAVEILSDERTETGEAVDIRVRLGLIECPGSGTGRSPFCSARACEVTIYRFQRRGYRPVTTTFE